MGPFISVIIPNRNGSATVGLCLEAVFASHFERFEVIVVDDCSEDNSVKIISAFPCRLIRLDRHSGASRARNVGAVNSRGKVLFFIDADCLVQRETLAGVEQAALLAGPGTIIGGTYTAEPRDRDFFSRFQSAFIRYFETKRPGEPDYVASHALVAHAEAFKKSGGFPENFLPIIEDVSFSHKLRKQGVRLMMDPAIEVTHIFNFSLKRSLRNAFRKSLYWTVYSLENGDLFADSGTASRELKANAASWLVAAAAVAAGAGLSAPALTGAALAIMLANALVNRNLSRFLRKTGGSLFAFKAMVYYLLVYPAAVNAGACGAVLATAMGRRPIVNRGRQSPRKEAA